MAAGIKVGGTIGLLMGIAFDISMYSMSSMFSNLTAVCVDIFVYAILTAITGGVVGLVMGAGKKNA